MTGSMEEEGMSMNTEPVTKSASERQPGDEVKMSNWPVIERRGLLAGSLSSWHQPLWEGRSQGESAGDRYNNKWMKY